MNNLFSSRRSSLDNSLMWVNNATGSVKQHSEGIKPEFSIKSHCGGGIFEHCLYSAQSGASVLPQF